MKKIYTLILIISLYSTSSKSQVIFDWANSVGGVPEFLAGEFAYDNAIDAAGSVYTVGSYNSSADFDPGPGVFNLSPSGFDGFIQKLDKNGDFVWAISIGDGGNDICFAVAVDSMSNVYVTGKYWGTVDFDPGPGTFNLTPLGNTDVFVLKLDSAGNFIWVKSVGGNSVDEIQNIVIDNLGNLVMSGSFRDTADFDPGPGIFNLTATVNGGCNNPFVLKLDSSGNFIWAVNYGSNTCSSTPKIATDQSENIYLATQFSDTIDFDPGVGVFNMYPNGTIDGYILKLDSGGNFVWVKPIGDNITAITADQFGNIFTTGFFSGTVDFDPGVGTFNLTSLGSTNMFLHKLDTAGNFVWAKSIESATSNSYGYSMICDASGNLYTTGGFGTGSAIDFDPGIGVFNLPSWGDVFVLKLDNNGNFNWAVSVGGAGDPDYGRAIQVSNFGEIYISGVFHGSGDFDPSAGIYNLTNGSAIEDDFFVLKFSQCSAAPGIDIQAACDSLSWVDGNTYTTNNNTATVTLTNAAGCDSVVTLDLTITNSNASTDTQVACDTYTWIDASTYTTSNNTATVTLTNAAGCDSVVTLDLTINNSATGTDTRTECSGYVWLDGNPYSANNNTATFNITGGAANGCDSLVTLDLTINTVDTSLTIIADTLTANATGATYQWFQCDSGFVQIAGATNQQYIAPTNGDYSVVVTQNGCSEMSACVTILGVGINENSLFNNVSIYPNPNQGMVNINLGNLQDVSIKVFSMTGQLLINEININTSFYQFELNEAKGIYFLEIESQGKRKQFKLIKQ